MLGETALCLALDTGQLPDRPALPDAGHRDGRRTHRPTQVGGPHAGHRADHRVTR